MKIKAQAYAKINWYLEILNKRNDGYHNISTLMQSINLADKLSFKLIKNEIILKSSSKDLENKENLVFKAARILKEYTKIKKGVDIFLEKRIPIGAGLAGGSADAACALKCLNKLWELNLKEKELYNLALQLGSDTAFHLQGGFAKAQGRGEILSFFPFSPDLDLILIYPNFKISTPWAYQAYDKFLKN
ncbi:MAG: 4-(cytidine 5'-diphospho)-2-C-methyl-D-erythritol kinase, partial [Armatimonadetes bacterium]|nr:4-(cytidine 5'-diphospho)-2-C-methyl-D-erythritol kinase [Armatimonadota bacterium]